MTEKVFELLQKDELSLRHQVVSLKGELLNLRLRHRVKKLDNPSQIAKVRRAVARVKTALSVLSRQKKGL